MENNNQSGEQVQANRQAVLGKILDWFRSAVLYAVLILVSEHFLKKDYSISGTWLEDAGTILFIALVAVYAAAVIVAMVMEKKGKYSGSERLSDAGAATAPLICLWEDCTRPFKEAVTSLKNVFARQQDNGSSTPAGSILSFIAYIALVAAIVIFGIRLVLYFVLIGA